MAQPTRVLVTGGNGLLGAKLIAHLLAVPGVEVASASREACANTYLGEFPFYSLDVSDAVGVDQVLDAAEPQVVVHTAAMTDVDACEREPQRCWRVNAEGTAHVARACGRRGIRLVHLSTEYVFDGLAGPYAEDDLPNPLGQYGRSKLAGERATSEHCQNWAVARTTIVYGRADAGGRTNFVLWLVAQLRAGQPVRIVADQLGSPTLADNLAEMVVAIALSERTGLFNTVGASVLDRYAFARLVAEIFGLDADLIQPITSAELRQDAPRPLRAGLRMDKFRHTFPEVPVLTAREGLKALRAQIVPGM